MKCPKCNAEIQVIGIYCPNCRADLTKEAMIELQIIGSQIEEQKKIRENLERQKQGLHDGGLLKTAEEYRQKKTQLLREVSELEKNLEKRISGGSEQSAEVPVMTESPDVEPVQEKNIYCPYCGNKVDGDTFCGRCGKKVN